MPAVCLLFELRRKIGEIIIFELNYDKKIFDDIKYKRKPELNCYEENVSENVVEEYIDVIYEINFLVFDKYLMEKRKSFKDFLM